MKRKLKMYRKTKYRFVFLLSITILVTTGFTVSGQNEFITIWQATGNTIDIPTEGGGYNYNIYWEEIGNETNNGSAAGVTGDFIVNTLPNANRYRVKISGDFPQIYFWATVPDNRLRILTVEQWGDISWRSMARAFWACSNLSITATDAPDLSLVTDMNSMFEYARSFNQNIGHWDVSNVTNMHRMFREATAFNQDISHWDVSNVANMGEMFYGATSFNQDIGNWNVGNVTNMADMFRNATAFNHDIGNWDVSNVTNMGVMFYNARAFNQNIGNWDVGNVTNMGEMFRDATAFNQDIGGWDVSKVTDMNTMFQNGTAFNQNLGAWNVGNVTTMASMLNNSGLSRENYDLTLTGWASQNVLSDVPFGAGGLHYCDGETDRNTLIGKGWTISGDSRSCRPFITTWQAINNTITIPTAGNGYNYEIFWEEIGNPANNGSAAHVTGDYTISLPNANQYRIKIHGTFPRLHNGKLAIPDRQKLLTVEQWGDISWTSMHQALFGCYNIVISATDAPDLSNVTSLASMFQACYRFNSDISHWDVSNITTMSAMFYGAGAFNQDISNWDVRNVTNMGGMFMQAISFNQDIGDWDVSNVTSMWAMFANSTFNHDIGNWDVSNVTDMASMFQAAPSFNQDISAWDVGQVTRMSHMFYGATSFNQDISGWDVGNVTSMARMFIHASSFNQDISNWDVSNVTTMESMFEGAAAFNQNISAWNVANVTTMASMLNNSGLSRENYDLTLTGWASQSVKTGVTLGASGLKYCDGETARNTLISGKSWTVIDDSKYCPQTITFDTLPAQTYGDVFDLTAEASSELPVTFSSSDPGIAVISGNNVTVVGSGTVTITASQGGNANFEAASSVQQTLTVTPKPVTVTVDSDLGKVYGEVDPVFSYSAAPALINGDVFSGSLARVAGEDAGTYAIHQNTLTAGSNYNITFAGADFNITPKVVTVTADAGQSKLYGESDPVLTYTVSPALINGDVFTGSLGRAAGENTGTYAINQHTLTAGSNYNITFAGADFNITPKVVTVTADVGQSKLYGESNPVLTYTVSPALVNGDVFTGSLGRAAGENTGTYAINQHTLKAGSNYTIVYIGADFHIRKLTQTITFEPIPDKTFGEDPFQLTATASSSLPLSFTSSDESIIAISGNMATITGTGEVTITVTQPGNDIYDPQETSATLTIHPTSFFIPTLFSPDGNGVNDVFLVRGADIAEIQFIVVDHLGNEVYRATDAYTATQKGWDGTKNGKAQPAGTYAWLLKGKRKNGTSLSFGGKLYGQVVLVR